MGSQQEIGEGLRRGAFHYLVKPLDPLLVVQVVEAVLAQAAERRTFFRAMEGALSAIAALGRGRFACRTLAECHDLAALLAHACPDPRKSGVGLSELMINALEHGNLGITYAEKTRLVEERRWAEEVERRQALPAFADRRVTVTVVRTDRALRFRIEDMGEGFDWRQYQEITPERLFDNHGRGIVLAKYEAFDRVRFEGRGNVVVAEPPQDPNVSITLFSTRDTFDRRNAAKSRIEAYLNKGPEWAGYLYENHIVRQQR
jgi:hypothetical protein